MIGNVSTVPYRKVNCNYTQNDVPLIRDGYLQVTDTTEETFKVVMYSGIIDLEERLKDKKLEDLNLTEYNHFITKDSYLDSFGNTEGYIYALANYGAELDTFNPIRIEYQAPCMFMHTIWDKIFTEAGYTYEGDIIESGDFKNKLVTPTNGWEIIESATTETFLMTFSIDELDEFDTNNTPTTITYNLEFNADTTPSGFTITSATAITSTIDAVCKFDITTTFDINEGDLVLRYFKNGSLIYGEVINKVDTGSTRNDTIYVEVESGDTITGTVEATTTTFDDGLHWWIDFTLNSEFDITEQSGGEGQLIEMNNLYKGVTQTAFIKDIMQHFGIILKTVDNNHLEFTTMQKLLGDKENAEDWTDKYVYVSNEDYVLKDYGINNYMKYTYEKDVTEFDYDGVLIVNNEHLDYEKTLFTSIFKIRETSFFRGGNLLYSVPLWLSELKDLVTTIKVQTANLSLFNYYHSAETFNLELYSTGPSTSHSANWPFLQQEDIEYQYFIDNYYSNIKLLLDRNKVVTATMNFNEIDLRNLDFLRLKYFKQTGKYYYLNMVKGSTNGLNTTELVEIP
ncbi:MAG: hypothetical protein Q8O62_04400 [Aequorivita sp.]|nr:hypothetical protein [Aequorivita sp.]